MYHCLSINKQTKIRHNSGYCLTQAKRIKVWHCSSCSTLVQWFLPLPSGSCLLLVAPSYPQLLLLLLLLLLFSEHFSSYFYYPFQGKPFILVCSIGADNSLIRGPTPKATMSEMQQMLYIDPRPSRQSRDAPV